LVGKEYSKQTVSVHYGSKVMTIGYYNFPRISAKLFQTPPLDGNVILGKTKKNNAQNEPYTQQFHLQYFIRI
jgi:hypothetical protein